jgi:hypothetical protein
VSTWISVPKLAERAHMTRQGMWKALLELDKRSGGKLMRRKSRTGRGGRFEVCLEVLQGLTEHDATGGGDLQALRSRVATIDLGLSALRSAHHAHKRRTEKTLFSHGEQLEALKQLAEAAANVSKVFAGAHAG